VAVGGVISTLILAALATGATPFREKRWPEPGPISVVLRTSDNVFVGVDLRYENGLFRLRDGKDDVTVDEPKVARITFLTFLKAGSEDFGLSVERLAVRLAYRSRFEAGPPRFLVPEGGVFILPSEPVTETFRWVARKVRPPEALAILCLEFATACLKQSRPDLALGELERAEKEGPDLQRGFVFGLMRAAVLHEQGRKKEEDDAIERLKQRYPDRHREIDHFVHPGERFGPLRPK